MVRFATASAVVALTGALIAVQSAQADVASFVAQLAAGNEVPPVMVDPAEANATGTAVVMLEFVRLNGVVTSATAAFDVHLSGLTPASPVILAQVHQGGPTVNGPVRIDSGISPGMPVPVQPDGSASFIRQNLAVAPLTAQQLLENPSGFYFNVHTVLSPGGVGRGQLMVEKGAPLLSSVTLLGLGAALALYGYRSARRRPIR